MGRVFLCDMCGRELSQHGDRYILRVEKVPALRTMERGPYDLCANCAERLRAELDKGRQEDGDK